MIALILGLSCSTSTQRASHTEAAWPMGESECAICGMDLAGQPAPRGQAAYRDGQHRFTCSIGDLRVLLQTPSPLGQPTAIWVEQDTDRSRVTREPQPWIDAEGAWFVFGIDRPEVMGMAALVFPDRSSAQRVATDMETNPVPWQVVRDTPFNERPVYDKTLEKP